MANFPAFFKVFLSVRSSQRLSLPPAVVPHVRGALPDKVKLKNHQGNLWVVKITSNEDKIYLTDGWAKFVQENNVQNHDILVFDYRSSYVLGVTLYGVNTCKKILSLSFNEETESTGDESDDVYIVDIMDEEEEASEAENNGKGEEKIGKCAKGKGKIVKRNACKKKAPISSEDETGSGDESDDTYNIEITEGEEEEEFEMENLRKGKKKTVKYIKGEKKTIKRSEDNHKGKGSGKTEKCSCQTGDDEDEIFKYGVIARPKTPYFVTKVREKRTSSLYIPLDVIKDFDLIIPNPIVIIDEKNRKWHSNVKVWDDGRTWVTSGWKQFQRVNQLTLQDRCLCELVKETGRTRLFLKMCILRAGSWLPNRDL